MPSSPPPSLAPHGSAAAQSVPSILEPLVSTKHLDFTKSQSSRAFLEDVYPQFSMIPVPVDVPVQSDSEAAVPSADCLVVAAEAGIAKQSIGVTVVRASLLRPSEPLTPVTRAMACAGPLHSVSHLPSPPSPAAIPNVAVAVPTHPAVAAAAPMPPPLPRRRCCVPPHRFCFPDAAATAPPPLPSLLPPQCPHHCPAVAAASPPSLLLPRRRRHCPAVAAAAPTPPLRRHPASSPSLPPYG
ncbi:hypothetical protein BGW80DRAFT_1561599 [Lactifluus volemus]|nr:hypothetical protein BGW80DRAFT_1561599 [Lactifluus volemus]